MLATLASSVGSIQVMDISNASKAGSTSPVTINAHKTDVVCVALSSQGNMVATASGKGTLIRLFDVNSRQLIIELRRGSDQAFINCISFNRDSAYICVTSDKSTVHVFALRNRSLNRRSTFAKAGKVGAFREYTGSQWSFCQICLPYEAANSKCFFGQLANCVVAVCQDGTFHKYLVNYKQDSTPRRTEYGVFLNLGGEGDF